MARVYGFKNIAMVVSMFKKQKLPYAAIEIMACPSGCLNGPAQPKAPGDISTLFYKQPDEVNQE